MIIASLRTGSTDSWTAYFEATTGQNYNLGYSDAWLRCEPSEFHRILLSYFLSTTVNEAQLVQKDRSGKFIGVRYADSTPS